MYTRYQTLRLKYRRKAHTRVLFGLFLTGTPELKVATGTGCHLTFIRLVMGVQL